MTDNLSPSHDKMWLLLIFLSQYKLFSYRRFTFNFYLCRPDFSGNRFDSLVFALPRLHTEKAYLMFDYKVTKVNTDKFAIRQCKLRSS